LRHSDPGYPVSFLPLALLLHALVDAAAVILSRYAANVWIVLGVVYVIAACYALLARQCGRNALPIRTRAQESRRAKRHSHSCAKQGSGVSPLQLMKKPLRRLVNQSLQRFLLPIRELLISRTGTAHPALYG
jgi:hypothetical protein